MDKTKGAKGKIYRLAEKLEGQVEGKNPKHKKGCDCPMCVKKKSEMVHKDAFGISKGMIPKPRVLTDSVGLTSRVRGGFFTQRFPEHTRSGRAQLKANKQKSAGDNAARNTRVNSQMGDLKRSLKTSQQESNARSEAFTRKRKAAKERANDSRGGTSGYMMDNGMRM